MNSNNVVKDSRKVRKDEKKKKSTENKGVSKENTPKTTQKENQDSKKSNIDWTEEKEILKEYLHQEYPLMTTKKITGIIEQNQEKYVDMDKYQTFFLRKQSQKLNNKIKLPRKLSDAPKDTQAFFDVEAKEKGRGNSDDEDDDDDAADDDNDDDEADYSEKSNSDDEDNDEEEVHNNMNSRNNNMNTRKRRCEYSAIENSKKEKRDSQSLKWLPNGNKV